MYFILLSSCYRFYDFAMLSLYCSYRKPLLFSLILSRELRNKSFTPLEKNSSYFLFSLPVLLALALGPRVPRSCCAPHSASGDIPVPPVSLHLKEIQEGGCDLFCVLRWTVRTLGWQGTLRSAFCLQSRSSLWAEFKFECYWNGWTVLLFLKEEERRNEENNSEFQHCNRSVGLLSVKVCFIHYLQDNYVENPNFY